jgi:ABC-type maltose transport system permease subunit
MFLNPTQVEYSSFAAASLWVACPPAIAFVVAHAFVDRRIRSQFAER